jgi:hypothetical protein
MIYDLRFENRPNHHTFGCQKSGFPNRSSKRPTMKHEFDAERKRKRAKGGRGRILTLSLVGRRCRAASGSLACKPRLTSRSAVPINVLPFHRKDSVKMHLRAGYNLVSVLCGGSGARVSHPQRLRAPGRHLKYQALLRERERCGRDSRAPDGRKFPGRRSVQITCPCPGLCRSSARSGRAARRVRPDDRPPCGAIPGFDPIPARRE